MKNFKIRYIDSLVRRDLGKLAILSDGHKVLVENEHLFAPEAKEDRKKALERALGELYQHNKEWTVSMYVHHTGDHPSGYTNVVEHIEDVPFPEMHHYLKEKAEEAAALKGGSVTSIQFALWPGAKTRDSIHIQSLSLLMKNKLLPGY